MGEFRFIVGGISGIGAVGLDTGDMLIVIIRHWYIYTLSREREEEEALELVGG